MSHFLNIYGVHRPSMLIPSSKKDDRYRLDMARSFVAEANNMVFLDMLKKGDATERALNDEIMTQEDIDTFLLDESGNVRNRVMFTFNQIRPIIEQYRGTAIQMQHAFPAQPVTRGMRTRRQMGLAEEMLSHRLGMVSKDMRRIVSKRRNIGDTMDQTAQQFIDRWSDPVTKAFKNYLNSAVERSSLLKYKDLDAKHYATYGLVAGRLFCNGGHPDIERIHPAEFFFDTTSRMPDASDADFMGCSRLMSMPRVAEHYRVDKAKLQAVEAAIMGYAHMHGSSNWTLMGQSKVRVYEVYWIDMIVRRFGYVEVGGIKTLVEVPTDDKDPSGWTDKDLVDPPDTEEHKELFEGRKWVEKKVECVQYAEFVPWEYMLGGGMCHSRTAHDAFKAGTLPDLYLGGGVYKLQGYAPSNPFKGRLPFLVNVHARMEDGRIVTPTQSAISPSRFVSRVLSNMEAQVNAGGGKTMLVDMDLVDPQLDPDEVELRRKQGRTIDLRAGGRGVSNAVGSHDDSIGNGAYALLQLADSVNSMIRTVIGGHEPVYKDMTATASAAMVQRVNLMQEAFHEGLASFYQQGAQLFATAGKSYYDQNPDLLADLIDDDDLLAWAMSRDMAMEMFNTMVKRDDPAMTRIDKANAWLDQLVQMGLVDHETYYTLYNSSDIDDITAFMRRRTAELKQAENEAQKEQAKASMMQALTEQAEQLKAREDDAYKDEVKTSMMLAREGAKEKANETREQTKSDNRLAELKAQAGLSTTV